jgi:hypothetical protein
MLTGKSQLVPDLRAAVRKTVDEFFEARHPPFAQLMIHAEQAPKEESGTENGGWIAAVTFLEEETTATDFKTRGMDY